MRYSRFHLRIFSSAAAIFLSLALSGCGNTCVAGFSINGNGGVIIRAGDPPPTCSLSQAKGVVTAMLVKSPVCESCKPPGDVAHVFVTLQSISIRPAATDDPKSLDWLELAPELETEPRQIDLLHDSLPLIVGESTIAPAESYREVRLRFLSGSPENTHALPYQNSCGDKQWNCVVRAGGRVEPLHFPGDLAGITISSQSGERDSLLLLPDTRLTLRLSLEVHKELYYSDAEGWAARFKLSGRATAGRQQPFAPENSTDDVR